MNKLHVVMGAVLAISVSFSGWASNPCKPIMSACMEQGYHNGGSKENKGLMENCVMPVVAGEKTLPNVTFSEKTRNKCKKIITKKMKAKIARDAKNKPAQ